MKLSPASSLANSSRGQRLLSGLLAVALSVVGFSALSQNSHYVLSTARPAAEIDRTFPFDLALVASRGTGDTLALSSADLLDEHRGKRPVVLVFWMTTCGPCRTELADIETRMDAWVAKYDFAFIPVSLDFPHRRAAFHQRAAAYPWTSYLDVDREFPSVMEGGLNGVPQVFVFDAEGRQVFHRRKYREGDLEELEQVLGR